MWYLNSTSTQIDIVNVRGPLIENTLFDMVTISTTISAAPGEIINSLTSFDLGTLTAKCTPSYVPAKTSTVTEYDIYLQDPRGNIWTTLTVDSTPTTNSTPYNLPLPYIPFVVKSPNCGWVSWSAGQKAGLIVGVICTVLLVVFFLWRCHRRREIWCSPGAYRPPPVQNWQQGPPVGDHSYGYYGPPQNLHTGWGLVPYGRRGGGDGTVAAVV